jgi:hypothetical protein
MAIGSLRVARKQDTLRRWMRRAYAQPTRERKKFRPRLCRFPNIIWVACETTGQCQR